jgi:hypothetical protein
MFIFEEYSENVKTLDTKLISPWPRGYVYYEIFCFSTDSATPTHHDRKSQRRFPWFLQGS